MAKIRRIIPYLLIVMAPVFIFTGCEKAKKAAREKEVIPVKVMRIELMNLQETLEYVGDIKAWNEAVVYPKVSGKIIQKIKEDGSFVEKGEAIAYIDRDEVGFKFEKAPVETPLTGIIGRIYVDKGENVTTQSPIALVVNMDKVKIDLEIPEKYLPKISLAQVADVSVDAYPDKKFKGKVTKISPVVDLDTRSAPIEISIDNPEHLLKSGMFAKVSLIIEEHKDIPVILKEAVMGREPNIYVYIVNNKKAVLKNIILGIRQGPYYEVTQGLKKGDEVVIMGQQRLYEGADVITEENSK